MKFQRNNRSKEVYANVKIGFVKEFPFIAAIWILLILALLNRRISVYCFHLSMIVILKRQKCLNKTGMSALSRLFSF